MGEIVLTFMKEQVLVEGRMYFTLCEPVLSSLGGGRFACLTKNL